MRIAIFSDIHSNVWALDAILTDLETKDVDMLINLGDILYGPLAPQQTYQLLQTRRIITVKGNHERSIDNAKRTKVMDNPMMRFVLADLSAEALEWIHFLPETLLLDGEIFLCHGTPTDNNTYMLEDVINGYLMVKGEKDIMPFLSDISAGLVLCGHSHQSKVVSLSSGQIIVNPGSVGLPAFTDEYPQYHIVENYSHHTSYAVAEKTVNGWNIELIKLSYPYQMAVSVAKKNGGPDWAHALATGRALTKLR